MKVGFIGLGNMGGPMAANLANAGFGVTGFDPAVNQAGNLPMADDARQVAEGADVIVLMLPNGAVVSDVVARILPVIRPGAILMDCSTIDVKTSMSVAALAAPVGVDVLDAPVSGGTKAATEGTLTFMVGGPKPAFEKAQELLDVMGQKSVHCGHAGAGQAAKLCNNMILGVTMSATCEAFALADRLGLDRQSLFDVVSTSSGYSWSMNAYCPAPGVGPLSPADNDYKPGFAAELMLKDLRLSQDAAQNAGADTPMGRAALQLYEDFVENAGGRGADFSALIKQFETDKL